MFRSHLFAGAAGLLLLAGCSVDVGSLNLGSSLGMGGTAKATALVVGDEPFAVRVGAITLAQGGDAVDAATAMYFALSVTYPVAAGLGGGGICIVHDSARSQSQEFDFLARDAAGGGAYAIPGNVRGFALMQSAYGTLPWQKVIAPAETYARTGFPISQALAARLKGAEDVVRLDAGMASEFMDEIGSYQDRGHDRTQSGSCRYAIGDPHAWTGCVLRGKSRRQVVAYSSAQGGAIANNELATYRADSGTPRVMQIGSDYVFVPATRTGAGAFAAALLDNLVQAQATPTGSKDADAAVIVAAKETLSGFNITSFPKDLGATGFAATDANGQSVACAVTMNGPFGSGHTALGTGVVLARAPFSGTVGLASAFLTPVIAAPRSDSAAELVGAGAGGPNGSAAIAYALTRIAHGEEITTRSELRSTGVAPYDTVNAIICSSRSCAALSDPGANGMGAAAH